MENGYRSLSKKKVKPKSSAVSDHLLLCNHSLLISSKVQLYCIMIDQMNELPEVVLKSSPETSRYIENNGLVRKLK